MADVEVIVSHHERATVRVGDVFLKIDRDDAQLDVEVAAMRLAPVPTPEVLWRRPNVLALAELPGAQLGRPVVAQLNLTIFVALTSHRGGSATKNGTYLLSSRASSRMLRRVRYST